ncbi:MAG: response regulator [Chloroflexi bacterium]|nr:response regulator [Chloroflexota bacterium]
MNEVNILIVDDDAILCEALSDVVEMKGGYSTERAGTAREALRKAGERFFNVALLDLTLPDMEGIDLLRQLRQLHEAMQIIILTGHTSLEKAAEAVRQGAFACLIKPSSSEEIMGAIQRALAK